jgi:type VII secretion-associated serine protease mycosin
MEPKQMRLRKYLAFTLAVVSILAFAGPANADAIRDKEYWLSNYGFTQAWKITKGAGVKVAVIDTGIDSTHPDLVNAVSLGVDISTLNAYVEQTPVQDFGFHGTMVASLLAGRGHGKNIGVIGTAPEAELISVAMRFDIETPTTDQQIASAIHYAVDAGAKVINLSLTRNSKDWPALWDEAFQYAFDHDVVVVAAAGNRAGGTEQVGAPATIPGVLVVAGVDRNAQVSNQASTEGLTIAVAAPATDLVSAYPGGEYKIWSGTSGAAPIVSGLVALVRAKYPNLDANNVINRVISTATKMDDEPYSNQFGYGLIDPVGALTADLPQVQANPLGSLSDWVKLYRKSTDVAPAGELAAPIQPHNLVNAQGFDSTQIVPIGVYTIFAILVLTSVIRRLRRRK